VLLELARTASTTSVAGRAVSGTPWLFPGQLTGQHITAGTKLNRNGIQVRRARNAALIGLAAEIPAAALSSLLDISIDGAVRWTHRAKRDWNVYVETRVDVS
jgi:hypothetical protein